MKLKAKHFPGLEEMSRAVARLISRLAGEHVEKSGRFSLVLSGGETPRLLYGILSTSPFLDEIPWGKVHLFWGDERFVPRDHPRSNYLVAEQALISRVPLPGENVHHVPVQEGTPEEAASAYEGILREFLGVSRESPPGPSFDLILLGMGADGHTASLFPGDPVLKEQERWVAAVKAPERYESQNRITLTLPVINRSGMVIFLVSGREKSGLAEEILVDPGKAAGKYPAALVRPRGELRWFIGGRAS